jgi:hypothetical protein
MSSWQNRVDEKMEPIDKYGVFLDNKRVPERIFTSELAAKEYLYYYEHEAVKHRCEICLCLYIGRGQWRKAAGGKPFRF